MLIRASNPPFFDNYIEFLASCSRNNAVNFAPIIKISMKYTIIAVKFLNFALKTVFFDLSKPLFSIFLRAEGAILNIKAQIFLHDVLFSVGILVVIDFSEGSTLVFDGITLISRLFELCQDNIRRLFDADSLLYFPVLSALAHRRRIAVRAEHPEIFELCTDYPVAMGNDCRCGRSY